jgi:anthranilate synthase component 1
MDFYSTILAFDHIQHRIVIMSHLGHEKVEEIESHLRDISPEESRTLELNRRVSVQPRSNFSTGAFLEAVRKAKEYIRAGDIFQVVLSQAFEIDFSGDPFRVYRALRFVNPSPYMFFLKQDELSIVGSSPEMLIKVQGRNLEYRPIAGTRRRGGDQVEEEELERDLLKDEKERAEHLMLVDLGRNDLGRVCEYGDVKVDKLMFLEKYSHVMHLVSSLKGRMRENLDRFDALAACFPAGTVSGAPKIRAMEIIEELEPSPRGIYAGAIGYIDYCGNLDTCIAIRTIVFENGVAKIQAGAGIVADSIPERENTECHNKAKALIHALELALS